jgi:HAD superfamily hydrolase (TIGR01509 family)
MKKLILFDCDGTLVDSEVIAARIFPTVWATFGVEITSDYFICNFVGASGDNEVVRKTHALLPPGALDHTRKVFHEELWRSLQAVQGMQDLLKSLPHQTCVASNSALDYVKTALNKTELSPFFGDRVYSSRLVGKPKPAPDVFLHAAKELGYRPEQCCVVEDSVSGIRAAQNAGMPVIGFMGGLHFNSVVKERLLSAKANWYCSTIDELKALLHG